jgi:hypothetical protein
MLGRIDGLLGPHGPMKDEGPFPHPSSPILHPFLTFVTNGIRYEISDVVDCHWWFSAGELEVRLEIAPTRK